jgi:hypothetical protein
MVPFSVQSAYGRESGRFDVVICCAGGAGLGKLSVDFGTIKKVDAGASTFLSAGFGVLAVWIRGTI